MSGNVWRNGVWWRQTGEGHWTALHREMHASDAQPYRGFCVAQVWREEKNGWRWQARRYNADARVPVLVVGEGLTGTEKHAAQKAMSAAEAHEYSPETPEGTR